MKAFAHWVIIGAALAGACAAEDNGTAALTWNGYFLADGRMRIGSRPYEFTWQEYRLDLKEQFKTEKVSFFAEVWLRSSGIEDYSSLSDLQAPSNVSRVDVRLREMTANLYGLGLKNLDVTLGRQRIAWGTADKMNPTDNLDADDLEDVWDFGRHRSSDAIKLTYYLGDYTFTGVYIPLFKPATLPSDYWMEALMPTQPVPAGLNQLVAVESTAEHIEHPDETALESSSGGVKAAGRVLGYDLSLSYAYCRDDFPLLYKKVVAPVEGAALSLPMNVDIDAYLRYPRLHAAGFDAAGAIGQVGIWAEAAMFFPEKVRMINEYRFSNLLPLLPLLPQSTQQEINAELNKNELAQDDEPYVKFVAGFDYTFPADIYVNLQYVHGLVYERGDSLEDFVLGNLDWNLCNNKAKFTPIGVGLEIKDYGDLKNNYAVIGQPKITWLPVDNAELSLGAHLIDGTHSTHFGKIEGKDEVFATAKISF
jgi:hypothetical protein